MIGRSIADSIGIDLNDKGVFACEGITGERVEITHRATDRKIFVRGALFAANYLTDKNNSLYNMFDTLNLEN